MDVAPRIFSLIALVLVATGLPACATFEGAQLYRSGSSALERGESDRAIADLERAAVLIPHGSEIQNHLGLAYAAAGRDGAALEAFRKAVALDCDNRAASQNLAAAKAHGFEVLQ